MAPVAFTNDAAAESAATSVQLRADGTTIDGSDVYTAGTARSLGVPLVGADDQFDAVEGLDVDPFREWASQRRGVTTGASAPVDVRATGRSRRNSG